MLAQPRDAGELRPVGDLVQRQPEPELLGREREALLEGEHVRARRSTRGPGRRATPPPGPRRRAGRTGRAPGSTSSRAACPTSAPATVRVTPDANGCAPCGRRAWSVSGRSSRWKLLTLACTQPARSVTRARAGPARLRSPVACGDELLGLGGDLVEVGLERVRRGTSRRTAPGPRPGPRPARRAPSRPGRRLNGYSLDAVVLGGLRLARGSRRTATTVDEHGQQEDAHADPVVPHDGEQHGGDRRPAPWAPRNQAVSRAARAGARASMRARSSGGAWSWHRCCTHCRSSA